MYYIGLACKYLTINAACIAAIVIGAEFMGRAGLDVAQTVAIAAVCVTIPTMALDWWEAHARNPLSQD